MVLDFPWGVILMSKVSVVIEADSSLPSPQNLTINHIFGTVQCNPQTGNYFTWGHFNIIRTPTPKFLLRFPYIMCPSLNYTEFLTDDLRVLSCRYGLHCRFWEILIVAMTAHGKVTPKHNPHYEFLVFVTCVACASSLNSLDNSKCRMQTTSS
jgi:hypothetical protein